MPEQGKITKKNTSKRLPGEQAKKLKPSGEAEVSFFEQVYSIVEQVPAGKVTTYGAIARALGSGLSARMVGWALNGVHSGNRKIPAQRVVNRNGQLSGKAHFGTPTMMQESLEKEGLIIQNDTIQNFQDHFWDPSKELGFD